MTNYTGDDIYCDLIIPRQIEVKIVKETNNVLAFYHTKQHWPVHIVVIPKQHVDSFLSLDLESYLAKELLNTVQEVASSVKAEQGSCRIITNLGNFQDSKHLHFHVVFGEPSK